MADARASATGDGRPRAISAPSDLRRGSVLGHLASFVRARRDSGEGPDPARRKSSSFFRLRSSGSGRGPGAPGRGGGAAPGAQASPMPEFPQAPTSAPLALPALSASQRKLNARAADKPLDEPPRRQAPLSV